MEAAPKKASKPSAQMPVSLRDLYFQILFLGLMLALGAMMTPFQEVALGPFGLFSNMAVIFALIGAGMAAKDVLDRIEEGWRTVLDLIFLSLFGVFLACEQMGWGAVFVEEPPAIVSIQDFVAFSLFNMPEEMGLVMTALMATIRFAGILAVLYGIGALVHFRKEIKPLWARLNENPKFVYTRTLIIFFVASLPVRSGAVEEMLPLEPYFAMAMGLSVLMAAFVEQPGGEDH